MTFEQLIVTEPLFEVNIVYLHRFHYSHCTHVAQHALAALEQGQIPEVFTHAESHTGAVARLINLDLPSSDYLKPTDLFCSCNHLFISILLYNDIVCYFSQHVVFKFLEFDFEFGFHSFEDRLDLDSVFNDFPEDVYFKVHHT